MAATDKVVTTATVNGHVDGRKGPRGPRVAKALTFADHVGALIKAFEGIPAPERERALAALRAMYPANPVG